MAKRNRQVPQAVLDNLPDLRRIETTFGPRATGAVHVQKYGSRLDIEFRDGMGQRIWRCEFRGV